MKPGWLEPPLSVYFIDGFVIRRGVAVRRCFSGTVEVHGEQSILFVWEDDIFFDFCSALRVLNTILE